MLEDSQTMSVDTMGPERRQCDNDDCEKVHEFCPQCDEKVDGYIQFEDGDSATESLSAHTVDRICAEWADDQLWIYWHENV